MVGRSVKKYESSGMKAVESSPGGGHTIEINYRKNKQTKISNAKRELRALRTARDVTASDKDP